MNSIALMGIATLYSFDVQGTAKILSMLAEKEQTDKKRLPDMHGKRTHLGDSDQLVYIISAVPGIGQTTAYDLLLSFGTIQKIATAEIEELLKVNGIGIKTARQIHSIFRRFYL
jgi:ERCC4-type nuclease